MNRAQQMMNSPPFLIDLEKGLYDQAKRKVATQRAIKQTEEGVSAESSSEPKKPRFTMQHLEAAKNQFKQQHGVAADTSRKSEEPPEWFQKGLFNKKPKKVKPDTSGLSSKERAATKRPGFLHTAATAMDISVKSDDYDLKKAASHSKAAYEATTATKENNTVQGHAHAMAAHQKAAFESSRLASRAQDRKDNAYGGYTKPSSLVSKHREKAMEHHKQARTHQEKMTELGGGTTEKSVPNWFMKHLATCPVGSHCEDPHCRYNGVCSCGAGELA